MVPEGWERTTIGEVCDFVNGNGFKSSEWSDLGLPIIRIQNLNGSKDFNYFSGKTNPRWLVSPGDILFAWAGSKGASFGAKLWHGPQGVLNQHIFKVTPKKNIHAPWLYEELRTATEKIENQAHGFKATLLHVQKSDITEQVINLPPFNEQKKIAAILSTWNQAITATENLIDNSRQQKKALTNQLLSGKKRFPNFSQKWKKVPITSCLADSSLRNSNSQLGPDDVKSVNKALGMVPMREQTIGKTTDRYKIVKNGWFAYNPMRINVGSICRWNGENDCLVSPDYVVFSCKDNVIINSYFDQFRKSDRWTDYMNRAGNGSVRIRIYFSDLSLLEIPLPPADEQRKISSALDAADSEIEMLQQKVICLKQEKKALMQQLLTGKRRVKVEAA